MRIGFDAKRAFHNFRGLGNYSRTLLLGLAQYHSEIEQFLFTPDFSDSQALEFEKKVINGTIVRPVGVWKSFSSLWRSLFLARQLKKYQLNIYLGNYSFSGKEYAGSHPAVDIKVPSGTPIYSIANGTVIKASSQDSGFGHHVVLRHTNFPSLDDPNIKTTIYSSYSHLGDLMVSAGDVVSKGQQLAYSGKTGTATTPHLHFQIDSDVAPWHPFWPFTWQEAQSAGYSFFEAVDNGLGQSSAITTTINPMKYVQKYSDSSSVSVPVASTTGSVATSYVDENVPEVPEVPEVTVVAEVPVAEVAEVAEVPDVTEPVAEVKSLNFDIEVRSSYYVNQASSFTVYLKDQMGQTYKDGFLDEMILSSDRGMFTVKKPILNSLQFDDQAKSKNAFSRLEEGKDRIKLSYNGETIYSDWFEIKKVAGEKVFSDVSSTHPNYEAIKYFADKGIIEGYENGTFRPNNFVTRVESLKFILEGLDTRLISGPLPFVDTAGDQWYSSYLYTGFQGKIVDGNPDGSFKPANTVTKSEFFKILFNAMEIKVPETVAEKPYSDVPVSAWFAPYAFKAKELGLISSGVSNFNPSAQMNRGEVAEVMFKALNL